MYKKFDCIKLLFILQWVGSKLMQQRGWGLIDKQSDHDTNRSIGNPVEAKSQGTFIGSMRHRYTKKYNAHQECSLFLLYEYRKVNKRDKQD